MAFRDTFFGRRARSRREPNDPEQSRREPSQRGPSRPEQRCREQPLREPSRRLPARLAIGAPDSILGEVGENLLWKPPQFL